MKNNKVKDEKNSENEEQIKSNKLYFESETLFEQINLIKIQIQNSKNLWQTKTSSAIENIKKQFIEFVKKIEIDIEDLKKEASFLENELFNIQKNVEDKNITFFQELLRKTIHFSSLSIPICYMFFSKEYIMMFIVPIMILTITFDILTKKNLYLRTKYLKTFGFMLRKHEIISSKLFLNGASWVMISAVITIFFFPRLIAIISLSVLFISDVIAAIIGRRFGKKRFLNLKQKSVVGTMTFVISAFLISCWYGFFFNLHFSFFIVAIISSICSALTEAISNEAFNIDDNLSIPISFGVIMWTGNIFVSHFFGYEINFIF